MLPGLVILGLAALQPAHSVVKEWTFDQEADVRAWIPNADLANVKVSEGVVAADAVHSDPFWVCRGIEVPASPWQFIVLRMKASRAGGGEIFWSGVTTGPYQGFSQDKATPFRVRGGGAWEEVVIFPAWQMEGTIRQLRLDVYEGAHFEIDSIRIMAWGSEQAPLTDVYSWEFKGDTSAWSVHPASETLFAPRLRLPVADRDWVTVALRSDRDTTAALVWGVSDMRGLRSQSFAIRGGNQLRYCNVALADNREWHEPIVTFGLQLPKDANVQVESIRIAALPAGPAEMLVPYFGFEDGVNRAGRPCRLLAQYGNRGGSKAVAIRASLRLPAGLQCLDGAAEQTIAAIDHGDLEVLHWMIKAARPGEYRVRLTTEGLGAPSPSEATLRFLPPLDLPKADYVPEPRPIRTDVDVCMYYFPGWESGAKWECIRNVAPIRKPLLGYYDEANAACVDWQIKWAAENGVSCYLVDWYWCAGSKHLEHWFEAYKQARYRTYLKVAIMWANHNPPNTHSREDWRNVTREWIDKYFPLDSYYRIDGKPAVFIWAPSNLENDLHGPQEAAAAYRESQEMAKAAGYKGITFVAVHGHESTAGVKALLDQGYFGATDYHEWGSAVDLSPNPRRADYNDIAKTVRKSWEEKVLRCGRLSYYPVVDTGWDSRPWHGDNSLVISNRTPDRFEDILSQAKVYCRAISRPLVVLGPANEWGEGSYIEPNNEFGFEMMERVRKVFGTGDPQQWPVNVGPADVGLGPYDLPYESPTSRWTFRTGAEGWRAMMGVQDLGQRDGGWRFRTTSDDPAIMLDMRALPARRFTKLVTRMQIAGQIPPGDHGQVFFSVDGKVMTEATSFQFALATDGQMHEYAVDLRTNPRWRSQVSSLRFDPCATRGVEVLIQEIRLE